MNAFICYIPFLIWFILAQFIVFFFHKREIWIFTRDSKGKWRRLRQRVRLIRNAVRDLIMFHKPMRENKFIVKVTIAILYFWKHGKHKSSVRIKRIYLLEIIIVNLQFHYMISDWKIWYIIICTGSILTITVPAWNISCKNKNYMWSAFSSIENGTNQKCSNNEDREIWLKLWLILILKQRKIEWEI